MNVTFQDANRILLGQSHSLVDDRSSVPTQRTEEPSLPPSAVDQMALTLDLTLSPGSPGGANAVEKAGDTGNSGSDTRLTLSGPESPTLPQAGE